MTGLTHSFTNDAAEMARYNFNSFIGDTIIQLADADNTFARALTVEGWQVFGVISGLGRSRTQTVAAQNTGVPRGLKGNVVTGDDLSFGVTFTHPTRLGLLLSEASNYASSISYAADGQTTVSSSTNRFTTVVADASNIDRGDMIEVDLTSGTSYGQFKEFVFVTNVSGTTVTHTRLSQTPAASADFKKVAGWGSAAEAGSNGFQQYIGMTEAPRYKMRVLTNVTSPSRLVRVEYYPEVEIINPTQLDFGDGTAVVSSGFTASVIQQTDSNLTDIYGVTLNNAPYLGINYTLPYES